MPRQDVEGMIPGPAPHGGTSRSLPDRLRAIWLEVLFPGAAPVSQRAPRGSLLLLLVLPGVLLYPCTSFRLFEPDEGRYAEIPREMLLRGEWTVPYLEGQPYLDKPPLLYWLVMHTYRLLGVHDWAARLVPAMAVHLCVLLTYVWGRQLLGERPAFWGALILTVAPGFVTVGRLLLMDGLLALWVTLGWYAGFEAVRREELSWGYWLAAAVACGLGVLTKGPVAILLVVPPLAVFRWLMRYRRRISMVRWLIFAAATAAVALPWYVAICARAPSFAWYFLWQHNLVRFLAPFDHLRPFWFYVPIVVVGLLPTSFALPFLGRFLLRARADVMGQRCPELGAVLLAAGWCFLFFSLSGCKLPTYILPVFPPLALALGYYLTMASWTERRITRGIAVAAAVLLAMAHYVVVPAYARYHSPLGGPEEVLAACRDRAVGLVAYPRECDSVAFYLGRDDLRTYRSKATPDLVGYLKERPRTVVVFTHRHSLETLRPSLPAQLRLAHERAIGGGPLWDDRLFTFLRRLTGETRPELYHVAVVERLSGPR